jgi:hypothetical protein
MAGVGPSRRLQPFGAILHVAARAKRETVLRTLRRDHGAVPSTLSPGA